MSILTIAWSMCAASSFMLGLLHLLLWFKDRRASVYLLSMLMAFSAGTGAMIEYRPEALMGKPVTALVPVPDRAALAERLTMASRAGPFPYSRWDLICASGARRSLAWSTVRLTDRDGGYAGLLSVGEDMTERLAAERNLERTRREMERLGRANMLGELVSALAHEINQPLAAILSNAQAARRLLASGSPDPGELREILDDIVRDDKRAGEVIQHLRLMLRKGEIPGSVFGSRNPSGRCSA